MFNAVRQNKVSNQIVNQIRSSILQGKLKPGDKLPSERELMEQFQVSKQTLRESLRALEHQGLIDVRKGISGGAYIVEVNLEITRNNLANYLHFKNLSIENLSEVRKLIEPFAAQRAAENISAHDLEKLRSINEWARNQQLDSDTPKIVQKEIQFHRTLAESTNNPILVLILDFIENLLEDLKLVLRPSERFSESVVKAHESIYDAILNRDPERASDEMYRHVLEVEEHLSELEKRNNSARIWFSTPDEE
jgi:GntR family transcriptional repressor for pyruvate dehydrogenase complex